MKKRFLKLIGAQRGFSLVELVLYISLSALVLGTTTNIMVGQVEAYSFLSNRQNTLSDARYAMSRMSGDLLRIPTGGITSVDSASISFIDSEGNATSFNLNNGTLRRGAETLLESVQSFQVLGLDSLDQQTAVITDMRKIQIILTSNPLAEEGSITLTTTVTPRVLVYQNYQ